MTLFIRSQKLKQWLMRVILKHTKSNKHKNIKSFLGMGLVWIIGFVIDHNINISKYKLWSCSSYIKLSKELDHPEKDLINIQNIYGNEFFKWCLVRYLHPANHPSPRFTNVDRLFGN